MQPSGRYEILDTIASGDFATVYRGRDHELGRDVAIKQIHQQFLADPRQLDRFWQEAQLLASLQHPHIMTIYDLVRERGWLILELMNGSLAQLLEGRPIDLKDLRLTLNFTLQGLQAMHRHGVLHGDVKPTNLLVDRNQRVKLGDFGIARHVSAEGSVVKGTTKYIAPEVVSDQFGPVGPHSDIYSLGFTAYELMCGEHFDSLFPGLSMYGRDRQMAWMMWHSALDRRLPEIRRVLDGVPPDLAAVIEKMTEKDPAKRYRNADEVLADLQLDGEPPIAANDSDAAAAAEMDAGRQRKRSIAIAAAACSIVLSIGMLFIPSAGPEPPPKTPTPKRPTAGEVVKVDLERGRLFVKPDDGDAQPITIREGVDRVFLNGQQTTLNQLDQKDHVQVASLLRDGEQYLMIEATRAAAEEFRGHVLTVDAVNRMVATKPENSDEEIKFLVGEQVPVEINGESERDGRPFGVADLRPQDAAFIRYSAEQDPPHAALIKVVRRLTTAGKLATFSDQELTLAPTAPSGSGDSSERSFRLAPDCQVVVNGLSTIDGRMLTIADLRAGDNATLEHDSAVHRVLVEREVYVSGTVQTVDVAQRTVAIMNESQRVSRWIVHPETPIQIDGTNLTSELSWIRSGDPIRIQQKSADPENHEAARLTITATPDPRAWALILEQNEYDNPRLPPVPFAADDATALHSSLRFQYRIPESQCLRERNATRLKLETSLTNFLQRVPADAQAFVFCIGWGFSDSDGKPFFAPQGFDENRAEATGVSLRWLIDQMEKCPAAEKMLVLDTIHDIGKPLGSGFDSASELVEASRPGARRPVAATVSVLASTSPEEIGYKSPEKKRGFFSLALSAAFAGQADADGDHRVAAKELAAFLPAELKRLRGTGPAQTPVAFWPDPKPARLSSEALASMTRLFEHIGKSDLVGARQEFETAAHLCEGQPDAHLVYAVLLILNDQTLLAAQVIDQVRIAHPTNCVAHQLSAWLAVRRGDSRQGLGDLERMVRSLPASEEPLERDFVLQASSVAGQLTGFALFLAPGNRRLPKSEGAALSAAIKTRPETVPPFLESYRAIERIASDFDQRIAAATDPGEKSRLEFQRGNFNAHVSFQHEPLVRYLKAMLER